jgi:Sec-independent protein secretion pathway component TatC
VSMILMALPLMVLYEISIFSARLLARRKAAAAAVGEKTD